MLLQPIPIHHPPQSGQVLPHHAKEHQEEDSDPRGALAQPVTTQPSQGDCPAPHPPSLSPQYVAATKDDSPPPRAPSGQYHAAPVFISSPLPEVLGIWLLLTAPAPAYQVHQPRKTSAPEVEGARRAFVDSMLRAEKVSAAVTARVEEHRQHRVRGMEEIKEVDRKAERAIAAELQRRQVEVEDILRKKKEEEHLKRLQFEEQRIKEEKEKMKKDSEEKRKREQEDLRLQELLEAEEKSKGEESAAQTPVKSVIIDKEVEESAEEKWRREEEMMIKLGREEHLKEVQRKLIPVFEKQEEAPKVAHSPKPTSKPAPIRTAPISEFLRPAPALTGGERQERAETRTLAVVEQRDKGFSSFNVFEANRQLQKPKYQTFSDQGGRSQSNKSCSSSASRSGHSASSFLLSPGDGRT